MRHPSIIVLGAVLLGFASSSAAQAQPYDCANQQEIAVAECEALVALFQATNGTEWTKKTNWLTEAPVDDWYGVEVKYDFVMDLDLSENNLSGQLPQKLDQLTNIRGLKLKRNNLTGTIPNLEGLFNLLKLELNDNAFDQTTPSGLSNMPKLVVLDLSNNRLKTFPKLENLPNLETLNLKNNQLEGDVPAELANLESLRELDISDNDDLSGAIPEIVSDKENLTLCYKGTALYRTGSLFRKGTRFISSKLGLSNTC